MKRRGTSRRQVLNLDTNSSSPKRSWQTKYQQIYQDHLNNTSSVPADPTPPDNAEHNATDKVEKLVQLVGYASDSENEQPNKSVEDLDSKVQDFLKEISDIVPEECSHPDHSVVNDDESREPQKLTRPKNKSRKKIGPSLPDEGDAPNYSSNENTNQQPATVAWQECYDENSGCYYYWNTDTNEVTWEMPDTLRAYHIALEQWNAHQLLLAQQSVGGTASLHSNQAQVLSTNLQQQQKKSSDSSRSQGKSNKRSKPSKSDSEDEKIELITSYGPTSDDEDSDDSSYSHSSKKKKFDSFKHSKKDKKKEKEITIGPQLPPGYIVPNIEVDKESQEEVSSCRKNELLPETSDELQSTHLEDETVTTTTSPKSLLQKPNDDINSEINNKQHIEKLNALQRLKNLKNKGSDESSSEELSNSDEESDKKNTQNNEENDEDDDDNDDEDDVEDFILERLKNKAKILQELGGEIPVEIKQLLETSSEQEEVKDSSPIIKNEGPEVGVPVAEERVEELKSTPADSNNIDKIEESKSSNDVKDVENDNNSVDIKIIESKIDSVEIKSPTNQISEVKEENSLLTSVSLIISNDTKVKDMLPQEIAPSSFSLIAGYGNEDDSEAEEDKGEEIKSHINGKPAPLFPIIDNKKEKVSVKSANIKTIKLSAKAKELIHSSITTEKARATDFIQTADGLKHAGSIIKDTEGLSSSEIKPVPEPLKKTTRKKRLEIPIVKKVEKASPSTKINEVLDKESLSQDIKETTLEGPVPKVELVSENKPTPYSSAWAYNSELRGGEYRGFGYDFDHNSDVPFQKFKPSKKGMIQFIKADTLMPKNPPVVDVPDKITPFTEVKQEDEVSNILKEQSKELAQTISEKVNFLSEGKEAVPPVQVMAIQLETLMAALNAGSLCAKYMWEWLKSLDSQLVSLEQAAAPSGWQCQWDRSYKRYYYRNDETGAIQWEYPSEQTQGGEEAMELCDSPPPLPAHQQPPATPPPPPRISSRSPSPDIQDEAVAPAPPPPPPPPVISEQPPLPPLPPSESPPPPPLPPTPPPPPPPPIISTTLASGEPLPPGVDVTDELFEGNQPPLPTVPPPPPKTPPPPPPPPEISESVVSEPLYSMGYNVSMHYDPYQIPSVSSDYTSGVYQTGLTYSSSGENYVIARPPASNPVPPATTNLANELDSFYSEVAALDPPPLPPPERSPSPPPPQSPPQPVAPSISITEPPKKKKKTKLAPGLTLKKKGVSSLVAKWQQVQQDVRRESANDDET